MYSLNVMVMSNDFVILVLDAKFEQYGKPLGTLQT